MSWTLNLSHLNRKIFSSVYEPSEDSFLMLDTLEQEPNRNPLFVCEIGSGSGIISAWLAKTFTNSFLLSTDLNPIACQITQQTIDANVDKTQQRSQIVRASYLDGIRGQFDLIVFNPPYVPTLTTLQQRIPLDLAWDGGDERGRLVIDGFLQRLPKILSQGGVCYLLVLLINDPAEIGTILKEQFDCEIINQRSAGEERLFVLKIQWKKKFER